jgi:hypothetical protein
MVWLAVVAKIFDLNKMRLVYHNFAMFILFEMGVYLWAQLTYGVN